MEHFVYWSRRIIAWYLIAIVGGVAAYQAVVTGTFDLMENLGILAAAVVGFYFGTRQNGGI